MIEKDRVPYLKQCDALNNFPYPGMLLFSLEYRDTIELRYKLLAPKRFFYFILGQFQRILVLFGSNL